MYTVPKLIAHRGNISGNTNTDQYENEPNYLLNALNAGFDIEVDIWYNNDDNQYYSGHDKPTYLIDYDLLISPKVWVHCKNIEALMKLSADERVHCFYHNNDDYTLTSKNIIWTYPNKPLPIVNKSDNENNIIKAVACMFSDCHKLIEDRIPLYGICCDNPLQLRETLSKLLYNNIIKENIRRRPDWHTIFMHIAHTIAERSTCLRIQTGALLVKDNRIISMGYNGSVPNSIHCYDYWKTQYNNNNNNNDDDNGDNNSAFMTMDEFVASKEFYMNHHKWSTANEIHGEQNAILYAARNAISTQGSIMYTVYSPCINCAKVLITAGITKCFFSRHYKRDQTGSDFLVKNGIPCEQIN